MTDTERNDRNISCTDKCDRQFVDCVDHYRSDCMERFKKCSSSCEFS